MTIYFIYWILIYVHILHLHMGRFAIAFLFCILAIFFWWTVKLGIKFQKVDWYYFAFSKCERPCMKRQVVLEMKKIIIWWKMRQTFFSSRMACTVDLLTIRPETLIRKVNSADLDFMKPLKELCSNTDVLHNDCVNIDSRCFSTRGNTSNNASLVLLAWGQFLISISSALHETLHWATDLPL